MDIAPDCIEHVRGNSHLVEANCIVQGFLDLTPKRCRARRSMRIRGAAAAAPAPERHAPRLQVHSVAAPERTAKRVHDPRSGS